MGKMKRSTLFLFLIWLLTIPPGITYIYLAYPPTDVNWLYIAIFIVFGLLSLYFPMVINGKPLFLVVWVTVPTFLMYGLFIEIIVMQISLLAILFSFRIPLPTLHRFCTNSFLFFGLSIVAATVFHYVGGVIGSIDFWPLVFAVFCYQLVHTFLSDLVIRINGYYRKNHSNLLTNKGIVDYASIIVLLPFLLTFYYLAQFIGIGAFLLIGIPYFFVTFILRLYNNSENINEHLEQAGKIGHEISVKIDEDEVIDLFVESVSKMLNTDFAYLFDHKDGWLELIRSYEYDAFVKIDFADLTFGQGVAGSVLLENKPFIYSNREDWVSMSKDYTPDEMESILCIPISRNQKIEAVLLLSSTEKAAFEEYQLKILDILCSYFTVSVEKARFFQDAFVKSERCALTNLYNYSYLENRIAYEMERLKNNNLRELSVIILDIDHFKQVNDTYGHQSGNDILCMFAGLLEDHLPNENAVVGRYGGEEFVYVLPNLSKKEALTFAENLRNEIEQYEFIIQQDLNNKRTTAIAKITASIGVSTAPEDTDDAKSLLRNADRSLYLWAKQAGRNRVAQYVK